MFFNHIDMKKILNFIRSKSKALWASAILALNPVYALAAGDDASTDLITKTKTKLSGLLKDLGDLFKVVIAIGALVALIMVIVNIMKGERDAASKAAYWLIGLVIGFIAISVVTGFSF